MSLRKDYNLSSSSSSTPIRNTSTPFPIRRKSILSAKPNSLFSRRCSLSDVDCLTPIQKNSRFLADRNGSNLIKSPVNLRKSPENKEKLLLNHQQMKYNMPGVFPIVHLNKRDLPILKDKTRNVTVRLASSELSRQNSAEHNRLLLEKVIQNSPKRSLSTTLPVTTSTTTTGTTMTNRNIEISTRSVLDALKEISRKRIHTNEKSEYLDDGKRIRLDHINDNDLLLNKKRQRGESPPYENCQNSNKQLIKRQCSLNEILASQSSMEMKVPPSESSLSKSTTSEIRQKNKKSVDVEIEIHVPPKKATFVNAETQTQILENLKEVGVQSSLVEINNENIEKSTVETSSPTTTTTTVKSSACLKVFDEAPLERTRKDRLSVLMGIKRKSDINQEEKPIMSILSSNINKHLKAHSPKHVTFDLESESNNETNQQQQVTEKTPDPVVSNDLAITQTTSSITTPLISPVVSETLKVPDQNVVQTNNETKTFSRETTPISFNQATTIENTVVPTFNFIKTTKPEISTNNNTKLTNPINSISTIPINNDLFQNSDKTGNLPTTTTTTTISTPPRIGGFKFDLNPNVTSNSSFKSPTTITTTQTVTQKPTFFFSNNNNIGLNKSITTMANSDLANVAPQFSLSSTSPKFNFTSSVTTTTPTNTSASFQQSNSTKTGGFNLSFPLQTTHSFVNPNPIATTTTTASLASTFGIQPTQSSVFGNPNPVVTVTTATTTPGLMSTFGIKPTQTNVFGNTNPIVTVTTAGLTNNFGLKSTQSNVFGNPNPVVAVTTATTTSGLTSTFGIKPTQTNVFGNPNPIVTVTTAGLTNSFGLKPTQSNVFGNPNPVVTVTTAGLTNNFGIKPTQSNVFGNSVPVVTATTVTTAGGSTFGNQTTTSNIFGSNSTPIFGSTGCNNINNNSFTNTNSQVDKPKFGNISSPQQNLFSTTTTTTTATTTTTSIFNTNAFNSTNVTNSAVIPPQINPPPFGMNNSTNIFGSNTFNAPLQQTSSVTTTQNPPPSFGNVFDTNKPPAFVENSTSFNTAFGPSNQNQPVFANNNNNTPTTNPTATSPPSGLFAFGGNNTSKTGVFSFGQNEPSKPTFNFATNNTGSNSFNNGNISFGTNNNNTNTVGGTPQFNPPVPGAMFNIGSGGSSTPRARTQLKAKRRT